MTPELNLTPRNGLATSSLVFGIMSFAPLASVALAVVIGHAQLSNFNLVVLFMGMEVVLGIAAIITGIVSLKQLGRQNNPAVAGIVLGTLAVASILLLTWAILSALSHFSIA